MDTKKLKQKILDLAIRGKLVPQDPNDEPASVLLDRIHQEKERLIKEKKIKRDKNESHIYRSGKSYYEKRGSEVRCIDEEIPFEVPESWEWCRLKEIGEIITGSTPPTIQKELYGKEYPFYKPSDLDAGINSFTASNYLSELGYNLSRKIPSDSILVTCIGATIGKTALINTAGACNQQINAITPCKKTANPRFLFYQCITEYIQSSIKRNSSATTLPILNKYKFERLFFAIPPLAEQIRIVENIERAFALIDSIESNKSHLSQAIKQTKAKVLDLAIRGKLVPQDPNDEPASVLLERIKAEKETSTKGGKKQQKQPASTSDNSHYPFDIPESWVWCLLSDIGRVIGGGTPSTRVHEYWDGDVSWITPADLTSYNSIFIGIGRRNLSQEGLRASSARIIPSGSVLYSSRAPIGYCVIAENDVTTNQGMKSIVTSPYISSEYLRYFLISRTEDIKSRATGTTFKEISGEAFSKTFFALPPLAEQQHIVMAVCSMFKQLDFIEESLKA